jgi:hypothetical protein
MTVDFEELLPPGFVVIGTAGPMYEGRVLAALPDEDGLLWLRGWDENVPRGWSRLDDSVDRMRMRAAHAPGPTWRIWRVYFAARRLFFRAFYPVVWRIILVLARLARVEIPPGATLRGCLEKMGAAVESERRAGRIAE